MASVKDNAGAVAPAVATNGDTVTSPAAPEVELWIESLDPLLSVITLAVTPALAALIVFASPSRVLFVASTVIGTAVPPPTEMLKLPVARVVLLLVTALV